MVGDLVLAKDITLDDVGLPGLGDIGHSLGKDGITVVGAAVLGQETDEALSPRLSALCRGW